MPPTNRDFRDLFFEFGERSVRYLVVGAYAVTHYSRPRFTRGLDLWIAADPENARRTREALAAFGAPMKGVTVEDLTRPKNVLQIGVTTTRIDIITSMVELDFEDCWPRRTEGTYMDVKVLYVSREDLIRNKASVGRPQDLLDVGTLRKMEGKKPPRPGARKSPPSPRRKPRRGPR